MSKNIAIIFAGGSGARMGSGLPKQFIEVNGKPIIIYTLSVFEEDPEIDSIYVACKEDYIEKLKRMVSIYMIDKVKKIVPGGTTGQGSIYNALKAAAEENGPDSTVLIHDGVRPCITRETIRENLACYAEHGSAVTCTPMFETPIQSGDGKFVGDMPKKSEFYTAQAPQTFRLGDVLEAHEAVRGENPDYDGIVDTCTLMKSRGKDVALVRGPRGNIKVTTPEDIFLFRAMIKYEESENIFGFANGDIEKGLKK